MKRNPRATGNMAMSEQTKPLSRAVAMEADFLAGVDTLRRELHIRPANGGTRDRLRIALAVADVFHTRSERMPDGMR